MPRRPCGSSPVAQRIKDTPPFPLALAGQRTWPASPAALLELAVQIERAREGKVFWHCGKACVLPSRGRRSEQLPPLSPRRSATNAARNPNALPPRQAKRTGPLPTPSRSGCDLAERGKKSRRTPARILPQLRSRPLLRRSGARCSQPAVLSSWPCKSSAPGKAKCFGIVARRASCLLGAAEASNYRHRRPDEEDANCATLLYSTLFYSTLFYSCLLYFALLYSTLLYSDPCFKTDRRGANARRAPLARAQASTIASRGGAIMPFESAHQHARGEGLGRADGPNLGAWHHCFRCKLPAVCGCEELMKGCLSYSHAVVAVL